MSGRRSRTRIRTLIWRSRGDLWRARRRTRLEFSCVSIFLLRWLSSLCAVLFVSYLSRSFFRYVVPFPLPILTPVPFPSLRSSRSTYSFLFLLGSFSSCLTYLLAPSLSWPSSLSISILTYSLPLTFAQRPIPHTHTRLASLLLARSLARSLVLIPEPIYPRAAFFQLGRRLLA